MVSPPSVQIPGPICKPKQNTLSDYGRCLARQPDIPQTCLRNVKMNSCNYHVSHFGTRMV